MSDEVYVIAETVRVHDAEGYAVYQQGARAQLMARGGSVVARNGRHLEGSPESGVLMIQKWPSEAAFVAWQESEEYRPLKALRLKSIDLRLAIVPAL